MPINSATQTVAMITGTVFAAAGLNLGVLTLRDPAPTPSVEASAGAGEAAIDPTVVENGVATNSGVAEAEVFTAPAPQALEVPAASSPAASSPTDRSGSVAPTESDDDRSNDGPGEDSEGPGDHDESAGDETHGDDADYGSPVPTTSGSPVTSPAPTQPPASPTIDPPTSPPETSPPATSPPATSPPETSPTTAAPTSPPVVETEYLTYDFTGIAVIVIALHDGHSLEFWSANTAPGWVYRVDDNEPDKVKIKFQRLSDGEEAEFQVKFEDGELDVKQED